MGKDTMDAAIRRANETYRDIRRHMTDQARQAPARRRVRVHAYYGGGITGDELNKVVVTATRSQVEGMSGARLYKEIIQPKVCQGDPGHEAIYTTRPLAVGIGLLGEPLDQVMPDVSDRVVDEEHGGSLNLTIRRIVD